MNFFAIIFLLVFSTVLHSQSIVHDACFDDWASIPAQVDNANDGGGLELLDYSVYDANRRLYLRLRTEQDFQFTDFGFLGKDVILHLDTDNNPNTGRQINGIGAELVFYFGERFFQVFHPQVANWERNPNDINLLVNPTVTGNEFEISLDMDYSPFNDVLLFENNSIKILFESSTGDFMPDNSVVYDIQNNQVDYVASSINKSNPDQLRLMAFNTLNEGLDDSDRIGSFKRIIEAINPDIISFNESNLSTTYVENLLDEWLGDSWSAYSSFNTRNIIASRYPIQETFILSSRMIACLIDLPDNIYDKDFLSINLHAQCCENDSDRQIETDRFVKFIKDINSGLYPIPVNTPYAISGDFNFVGDKRQLNTLLTGDIINESEFGFDSPPDWDGSSIMNVKALDSSGQSNFSWYNFNSYFSPGKLDFILYSDSQLVVEHSYIFNTLSLDQGTLQEFNLDVNDSGNASDHLPIVADLRLRTLVSSDEVQFQLPYFIVDQSRRILYLKDYVSREIRAQIFTSAGQEILHNNLVDSNNSIDLKRLAQGIYFIRFSTAFGEAASSFYLH